jgi:branched-chain amino acid transport system substrate-binding protein
VNTPFTVALVTPLTGPLATNGLAGLRAVSLWARDALLPAPWDEVTVTAYDAHPDPVAAVNSAVAAEPQVLLGPAGNTAAIAVAGATSRLLFNHGGPTTRLMRQSFPNVVNVAAPASGWLREALAAVRATEKGARTVTLLTPPGDDALERVSVVRAAGAALGFEITIRGFRPGKVDAAVRRMPPADVLLVDGDLEDETSAAQVLLERPWRAVAFSRAGDITSFAALGTLRDGVLAPRSWVPEADPEVSDGPSAASFAAAYRDLHGLEATPAAARAYATGVVIERCIRASGGSDDISLGAAARGLDTVTLFGRFRLDPITGLQVGHRIRLVQWQDGARVLVWPPRASQPAYRRRTWRPATAS